ncbi:MAG TPA: amidohydrolase, partial [Alteromonas australica]|nr:amidohydrolase [Alteromonas australica]
MIKTTIALLSTALIAGLSAQTAATPSDDNTTVDTLAETSKYDVENWQVTQPPFKLNEVAISTNETTWSSLDVSPNGKFMIFDMLGDLYKVDIKGGNATPLIQDFAWNIHPAISPDGKQVAFVSDRDGLSNVWVMDIDGTHLKQITREKKNIIHAPKWSPDGEYLVVTKGIMSSRSIPAGEIWMYHKSGGDGLQIKARNSGKRDQQNIADPAFSHDGRYIYFTENTVPGSRFEYNRDPLEGIFAITRYDRESGDERRYISGTGGAVVPTPSPDGKYVAFVRRVKDKTALFLKDIKTGTETPLTFALERDMQEGFGSEGYFTYFDWTPDASAIVYWSRGKFHIINVDSKETETLNVHIDTTVKFADALRFPVDVAPDNVEVKMTRWSQMSPNGKSILFQALGKLYVRDVKSGKVKRLTKQNDHDEYYPRYSNDGKSIVYTTWNDQDLGTVRVVSARGGKGKVISVQPGHYIEPSFSTDGKKVVFRKFTGGSLLDPKYSVDPGIYVANLKNDTVEKVADSGYNAHFAGDNERIF